MVKNDTLLTIGALVLGGYAIIKFFNKREGVVDIKQEARSENIETRQDAKVAKVVSRQEERTERTKTRNDTIQKIIGGIDGTQKNKPLATRSFSSSVSAAAISSRIPSSQVSTAVNVFKVADADRTKKSETKLKVKTAVKNTLKSFVTARKPILSSAVKLIKTRF